MGVYKNKSIPIGACFTAVLAQAVTRSDVHAKGSLGLPTTGRNYISPRSRRCTASPWGESGRDAKCTKGYAQRVNVGKVGVVVTDATDSGDGVCNLKLIARHLRRFREEGPLPRSAKLRVITRPCLVVVVP